jgi:hypothetical protein
LHADKRTTLLRAVIHHRNHSSQADERQNESHLKRKIHFLSGITNQRMLLETIGRCLEIVQETVTHLKCTPFLVLGAKRHHNQPKKFEKSFLKGCNLSPGGLHNENKEARKTYSRNQLRVDKVFDTRSKTMSQM